MVILIGGASCTGKTTMAQHLLERYKIPYLSMDHVKMGLIRSNPDCGFGACDSDKMITGHVWPVIKEMIKTIIENEQHMIVEGCYVPQKEVLGFEKEYQDLIIPLYLGFSKDYIENVQNNGIIDHLSETEYKDPEDYCLESTVLVKQNQEQKVACAMYEIPYFEVQSDYQKDLHAAYQWIDRQVKEKRKLRFHLNY